MGRLRIKKFRSYEDRHEEARRIAAAFGVEPTTVTGVRRNDENGHPLTRLWKNHCKHGDKVEFSWKPIAVAPYVRIQYRVPCKSKFVQNGRPLWDKETYWLPLEKPPYPTLVALAVLSQDPSFPGTFKIQPEPNITDHELMEALLNYKMRLQPPQEHNDNL